MFQLKHLTVWTNWFQITCLHFGIFYILNLIIWFHFCLHHSDLKSTTEDIGAMVIISVDFYFSFCRRSVVVF